MLVSQECQVVVGLPSPSVDEEERFKFRYTKPPFDDAPMISDFPHNSWSRAKKGSNGWFAVEFYLPPDQPNFIIASRFDQPNRELARLTWLDNGYSLTGDHEAWNKLTNIWFNNERLTYGTLALQSGNIRHLKFDWFRHPEFDPGYEAPVPHFIDSYSGDLIVRIHRTGTLYFCDPLTSERKSKIDFEGGHHGGQLETSHGGKYLWLVSVDTLYRINLETRRIEASRKLEEPIYRPESLQYVGQIIAQFTIQENRNTIWVARPNSRDVVALRMDTLETIETVKINGEPFYLAVVGTDILAYCRFKQERVYEVE